MTNMKNLETKQSETRNFSFENLEVYSKIRNLIINIAEMLSGLRNAFQSHLTQQ